MTPPTHLLGTPAITENLLKRKWSIVILRHFENGLKDPEEITRLEEDLSPAVMNERLRTMHRYCLIARYPRSSRPKAVDYRLTPKGRRILRMLELISQLDRLSDQDPRSLEDILRADLALTAPSPLVLANPTPERPVAVKLTNPVKKASIARIRTA